MVLSWQLKNKKKKETQKYRTAEKKQCSLVKIKGDKETWYDLELNLLQLSIDKIVFTLFYYVDSVSR